MSVPRGPETICLTLVEFALGRGQQVLALARALGSELRVAADDQALARELVGGDLGEVGLVEQRQLQLAGADQLADLRASSARRRTRRRAP